MDLEASPHVNQPVTGETHPMPFERPNLQERVLAMNLFEQVAALRQPAVDQPAVADQAPGNKMPRFDRFERRRFDGHHVL